MLLPKRLCTLGSLSFASLPLLLGTSSWGSELSEHHVSPLYKNESTIKTYGPMTRYASALQKKLINIESDPHKSILPQNIAYINAAASLTSHHQSHIQKTLASGGTVIIDSTENQNKAIAKKISATLGGIGFDSPIIMIRKNSDGISEYKQLIPHFPEDHDADKTPSHHLDHEMLSEETVSMLQDWQKKSSKYRAKERDNHYRPEVSIPVELRYTNFPCMVGDTFHGNGTTGYWYWNDKMIDACNKNASVSLFYTVDLIRSVSSTAGGADDAKYVRITVDPSSNGGAGWHLTDQPDHKHTWFQSWTNRETWFGPVADSYYVTIQSHDPDVHLYNTIPSNHPKESQIMHTIGLQVGVSGGPSLLNPALMAAGAAGQNPLGFSGINMGLSFTYTSERAISYNNHEYELINLSRAGNTDKAAWIWSREFDKYAQHWRTNRTCELWCQDWFYDDVAFSAASYSSFTPGFSATFQVPANKGDTSTLEFESAIKAVALGGRVQYAFLFQHYTPWGFKGTKYSFKQNIDINWGATFFNAEIPVSIEAYKESSEHGICLEVIDSKTEAGSKVGVGDCHFNQNQIWGMDSEFRYKSFLAQDRCLTREGHETLTIRPCTHAANQKWEWENEHLINNLGGAMTIKEGNRVIACPHTQTPTEWRNFIRKPDITDTMTVSALTMTTDEPNAKRPQRTPDYSPEPNSSATPQEEDTVYPPSSTAIDNGIEQDIDDDTDYDSVNEPLESTENQEETVWSDESPLTPYETDQASSAYSALDANARVPSNAGTESTYTMIIKQTNDDD
ncbi:leukocidin family pore-forming toxin [Kistimonas asteriae]|uniref:leukocidin family pore-forming toxin n=1 Tax=Kistimonas asteriae TaxID=517724 RepID=UPI001BA520B1|nr:leukocidin family pore-forming toxin [Kistimonas asteriae]